MSAAMWGGSQTAEVARWHLDPMAQHKGILASYPGSRAGALELHRAGSSPSSFLVVCVYFNGNGSVLIHGGTRLLGDMPGTSMAPRRGSCWASQLSVGLFCIAR